MVSTLSGAGPADDRSLRARLAPEEDYSATRSARPSAHPAAIDPCSLGYQATSLREVTFALVRAGGRRTIAFVAKQSRGPAPAEAAGSPLHSSGPVGCGRSSS